MKVPTTLSLSSILLGLVATPTLAQQPNHDSVHMTPVSVLAPAAPDPDGYVAERGYGITVGGFIPTDTPSGVSADLGFSIALERIVQSVNHANIMVSLRFSHYTYSTAATTGDINLISPTVGYRYRLGYDQRFYIEPSVGIVFVTGRTFGSTANTTDFAYGIAGGYDFKNNWFADLRYVAGGTSAEQGLIFSLGGHF